CLAALIDLGHLRDVRASSTFQISVLEQEMRTQIFWVIYTFERALGTMMGRAIGVQDELASGNVGGRSVNSPPSHMTYSIHLFRLARLNSEIKYIMHSVCREAPRYAYPPVPDIQVWQIDMVDRLKKWHITIPRSDEIQSITRLCECKYHEMMVLLLRASPAIPEPSETSLTQCFRHATSLVRGLGALYIQDSLLYSRFVAHSTFLSILLILHFLWKISRLASQVQISDVIADTW
ncbi:hypothetical protein N7539_002848, partial [Penicillium diatomitis]